MLLSVKRIMWRIYKCEFCKMTGQRIWIWAIGSGMPLGYKTDHERSRVRKIIGNGVEAIKVIGLDGRLRMSMNITKRILISRNPFGIRTEKKI